MAKEKKKLRKEGAPSDLVPEDDPSTLALSIKIMISRMFAEFEQRKKQLEVKSPNPHAPFLPRRRRLPHARQLTCAPLALLLPLYLAIYLRTYIYK